MKIFKSVFVATLMLLPFPSNALADNTMTAKNVLQVCTTPDMHWVDFCNGFFQAVHDQQASLGKLCAPTGTTRTNMVEIYEKNAAAMFSTDSAIAEEPAVHVAGQILSNQFPCQ